jgi:hypothetical protein
VITLFDPEEIGKTEFIENTLYAAIDRYFDFHERVKSVIPDCETWLIQRNELFGGKIPSQMIFDNEVKPLDAYLSSLEGKK